MRSLQRPPVPALAVGTLLAVALGVSMTYGIGAVLVLATAAMLVGGWLADRYVVVHMNEQYPRHGDHMD